MSGPNELFVILNRETITEGDVRRMTPVQITWLIARINIGISACAEREKELLSSRVLDRDPAWKKKLGSTQHAKMMLQQSVQWIGAIRKEKNIERKATEDELFRQVAHSLLDSDTYSRILIKAQAMMETA